MAIYCGSMYIAHKGAGGRENCPRRALKAKTTGLLGKGSKAAGSTRVIPAGTSQTLWERPMRPPLQVPAHSLVGVLTPLSTPIAAEAPRGAQQREAQQLEGESTGDKRAPAFSCCNLPIPAHPGFGWQGCPQIYCHYYDRPYQRRKGLPRGALCCPEWIFAGSFCYQLTTSVYQSNLCQYYSQAHSCSSFVLSCCCA